MKRYRTFLPDAITVLRFILTALFLGMLMQGSAIWPAGVYVLYGLICLSDFLDGAAARALKAESALGGVLDISADSLFIFSSFAFFNFSGILPVWFTAVVLADFLVFLTTSGFLIRKRPENTCRTFVFDAVGRVAAALFYGVPIAAWAVYSHPENQSLPVFDAALGVAAVLAAVSMAERGVFCFVAARRHLGQDTESP